ncbi:DedA family protein [Candidatus Peregrinibacteria bacterium]|jgi:membrane protein DedA with SNARE-associated domain|nr:DedA family protein [Candidatus Peregrinibacteria bacterium]
MGLLEIALNTISQNISSFEVYSAIAIFMFLNTVIFTPPSEIMGIVIGIIALSGKVNIFLAIGIASIANLIGMVPLYYIGRYRSNHTKVKWKKGIFKSLAIQAEKIEAAYEEQGKHVVLILRNVPFIRALCSYPAGKIRMPFGTFLKYSFVGTVIWLTIWISLGYFLGKIALLYHWQISLGIGIIAFIVLKLLFRKLDISKVEN